MLLNGQTALIYRDLRWDFESGKKLDDLGFSGPALGAMCRFRVFATTQCLTSMCLNAVLTKPPLPALCVFVLTKAEIVCRNHTQSPLNCGLEARKTN